MSSPTNRRLIKAMFSLLSAIIIPVCNLVNPPLNPFVPEPEEVTEIVQGPTVTIAQTGQSEYKIIRGENCSPAEKYSSEILQEYLGQICGVTIPIVTDTEPSSGKEIILGRTNREDNWEYTIDRASLGEEGLFFIVLNRDLYA